MPWSQTNPRITPELRIAVKFNQLTAAVGAPIQCLFQTERFGFRGYGMMLAEIGLPPWPTAGGVSFDFTFRTRMEMTAKSAASVLYDYYNPEARAEAAPILVQSIFK